jgi:creatinine amidohydrolase
MAFSSRLLGDLRAPELPIALTKDSIIVLPLGAIEQHGPHLPMNTDFVVADEVSRAALAKAGEETNSWLLPTLPFTKSNEHAWAGGTMWLSAPTMMAVLDDIGRSIAATNARKVLFINGHGGNSALVAMMNRELRLKYGLQTFLAHPHMPADQGGSSAESELGMGVHGGMDETSVMLHLRPELVDMSLAVRRVPEGLAKNSQVKFGGRVAFGWLSNDFFPEGHIGDPTGANAEVGKRMFDSAVESLCDALTEISHFDFGR